jgi:serine/threonine protein phosphatase 1
MKIFQNLLGKRNKERPNKNAPSVEILELFPFDGPVYVVGDIHGCLAALLQIESLILQDAAQFQAIPTIVLLGDMVDRGPQTAALIDHVMSRQRLGTRVICLKGNHEDMMLDFLANPEANMDWLDFGGYETLASYGIDITDLARMAGRKLSQILGAHVPQSHINFLQGTLPGLQVGQFLLTHAGADRDKPLTAQPLKALLWGSAGQVAPQDLTLIHGHFVVAEPMVTARCLAIDTGAYINGRLTSVRLLTNRPPAILTLTQGEIFVDLQPNVF